MARHDFVFAFIWIALGVFLCAESFSLGLGSIMEPGPGFMPFVMGPVTIGLAIALFIESYFRTRKIPQKRFPPGRSVGRVYEKVMMKSEAAVTPLI